VREAKTWIPDLSIVGVKPFWLIGQFERDIHEGLAQWWYEGEWFSPNDDPYLEDFLKNFYAFSDDDSARDSNSVNLIYWLHDMAELAAERAYQRQNLRAFQRDVSESRKKLV